jgi:GDP-4-dehydro-6-deoxy-D-mannose reductase
MKILITGAGGFVGAHLIEALRERFGAAAEICATTRKSKTKLGDQMVQRLDVTDRQRVELYFRETKPTHVIHLAGLTTVEEAQMDIRAAWRVHVFGTLNIARAILHYVPDCFLVHVSSGQVYGTGVSGFPVDEKGVLAPANEYGVTKAAAELALGALCNDGLRVIRIRPFNHTGPGQSHRFAVPGFARQIVHIERGLQSPVLKVGNLDTERDFLDVRDVVRAYATIVARANELSSCAVLNIASGTSIQMGELLRKLLLQSTMKITVEIDQNRTRQGDNHYSVGSPLLARKLLDWIPKYSIDETIFDVLQHERFGAASDFVCATPIR